MLKRNITLFSVLIFIIGLAIYWVVAKPLEIKHIISEQREEEAVLEEEVITKEEFPSDRGEKFYISGGKEPPVFTREVIVDPFKTKEGEKQTFSIWAKDPKGIERVTATIKTDAEDKIIELELVEGTNEEGRWLGSWTTKNISANPLYSTVFQAVNKEGKDTKMTLSWQVER